jgi:resuscitation-promoting factor RpfA
MTAIAAAIAFTSTPLLAQSTEPETTTPAPATEPAPAPAPTADPLAPAPTAETPTVTEPAAPVSTSTKRARTTATKATTSKTATARTTRVQPAPARTASTAAAPAVASTAPAAPPIEAQPAPTEPIVPVAAAVAANEPPAPVEQPSAIDNFLANDEALPIAGGAAGLGIITLAGLGLVSRRRRRRREAEEAEWQEYVENTPAALGEDMAPELAMAAEPQPGFMPEQTEPAFVKAFAPAATVAAASEPVAEIDGPVTTLPEDFDLSRFGPHVQAAYKGPTPDNPSLSLKYRLRRATALDQMARKRGTAPVAPRPAAAPAARPAMASQSNGEFLLRRAGTAPNMKPAFSK